jgi:hypothetical protein
MDAMGHRTTHRPGRRREEPKRPSAFFLIALALGVILIIWLFTLAIRQPVKPKPATTTTLHITSTQTAT